jgi:hypothetical protein
MGILALGATALLSVGMLWRNEQVARFSARCIKETFRGSDWIERRQEYAAVSYFRMCFQFWKPLHSFYAGTVLGDRMLERELQKTMGPFGHDAR